jgi:hypothetical protein
LEQIDVIVAKARAEQSMAVEWMGDVTVVVTEEGHRFEVPALVRLSRPAARRRAAPERVAVVDLYVPEPPCKIRHEDRSICHNSLHSVKYTQCAFLQEG